MDPPLALAILAGGHACSREGQGTQQAGNQQIRTELRWPQSGLRPLSVSGEWCWPIREGGVAFRLRGTPRRGLAARAHASSHTHTHTHKRRVCERSQKCRAVMPNCVPLVAGGGPPAKRGLQVLCKSSPHTRTHAHTHTRRIRCPNPGEPLGEPGGR